MIGFAAWREISAYRSLAHVEQLRTVLTAGDLNVVVARQRACAWLDQIESNIADRPAVQRMLRNSTTMAELRSIVRSHVADRLQQTAASFGKQAALEGATLVAICPHPALDGLIAAGRSLLLIRQVASLYGLRPGLAVTIALVRRVIWTAASTTGLSLISQTLTDHTLTKMPILKHFAGVLPGTSVVAMRLYRLAGITAQAYLPTPDTGRQQ